MADPDSSRRLPTRDLALIALFAGLIAVLGLPGTFTLFGSTVPVTAQTLGIMLAGSILGARRGALAVLTLLALVAAGLPLLAGGRGGLAVFAGPSVGYLIGWVAGAWAIGWLTERILRTGRYTLPVGLVANTVGGVVVMYAIGAPVLVAMSDTSWALALIYLPGDALKVIVATAIARGVHAGYPVLAREQAERALRDRASTMSRASDV